MIGKQVLDAFEPFRGTAGKAAPERGIDPLRRLALAVEGKGLDAHIVTLADIEQDPTIAHAVERRARRDGPDAFEPGLVEDGAAARALVAFHPGDAVEPHRERPRAARPSRGQPVGVGPLDHPARAVLIGSAALPESAACVFLRVERDEPEPRQIVIGTKIADSVREKQARTGRFPTVPSQIPGNSDGAGAAAAARARSGASMVSKSSAAAEARQARLLSRLGAAGSSSATRIAPCAAPSSRIARAVDQPQEKWAAIVTAWRRSGWPAFVSGS